MSAHRASPERTRCPAWCVAFAFAALWAAAPPLAVHAQTPENGRVEGPTVEEPDQGDQARTWPQGEWRFGGSLGIPGTGMQPFPAGFTLGAHALYFPRGLPGFEGSVGFAPLGLAFGGLLMGGRAGITVPLRADSLLVFPSAGVSALGGASRSGVDMGFGLFYAGLATLHISGLRVGATVHWRHWGEGAVWLLEVGGIRL